MPNDYIPNLFEDVEYYDKKYNYQKKTKGKVTKITDKYIFLNVLEQDIINFERTDVFEAKKAIDSVKVGDKIKFKRNNKQKEYYEGKITSVGHNALEIEYISEAKIEPVYLDQNFAIEKIKKVQELHGKKIKDSVYEKRIDNLLTKTVDEKREKLKQKVQFYTKQDAFPPIDVEKFLNEGYSPSAVMYADLIQKKFSGNNCKSLEEIEDKDQCNEFYNAFGEKIRSTLVQQKSLAGAKQIVTEIKDIFTIDTKESFAYRHNYGDDEKEAKERYWNDKLKEYYHKWLNYEGKIYQTTLGFDTSIDSYAFKHSNTRVGWSDEKYYSEIPADEEDRHRKSKRKPLPPSEWQKFLTPEAKDREETAYKAYVDNRQKLRQKYSANVDQKYINTLSENFSKFFTSPPKKDQEYLEDIDAIASFEHNFSADALNTYAFHYYHPEEEQKITSKEEIPTFVKNFLVSKQIDEYMEGKGGVKTKIDDILKIIKSKDDDLKENRFNIQSVPMNVLDKKIQDEFGIRAIQYGISVQQGSTDYKHDLLELVYGSLSDLAKTTQLDPRFLGLGNIDFNTVDQKKRDADTIHNLGLAIGARGQGEALAHYEPDENVINLTKNRGNGSFAHEWGHAFDRYMRGSLNDPARIKKARSNYEKLQHEMTFDDVMQNLSKYTQFLKKYPRASVFEPNAHTSEKFMSQGLGDIIVHDYEEAPLSQDLDKLVHGIRYSDFCTFSKRIDPKYLGTDEECFARAFQSFVSDKSKNRYLATNTNTDTIHHDFDLMNKIGNDRILLDIFPQDESGYYEDEGESEKYITPEYQERTHINSLFENVFKHKEELQATITKINAEKMKLNPHNIKIHVPISFMNKKRGI